MIETVENRRNYYRILHVQPDAPLAIVKMSYRTLMQKLKSHPDLGGDVASAALLNEAYAVISDPIKRALYDEEFHLWIDRQSTDIPPDKPQSAPKPSEPENTQRKKQAIQKKPRVRCIFCNTLQTNAYSQHMINLSGNHLCLNCNSPLQQSNHLSLEESCKRAIHRVKREDSIQFFTQWPQTSAHQGIITDLSPNGLGFKSSISISHESTVKIDSKFLQAVIRVINCRQFNDKAQQQFQCGGQFLTLAFRGLQGNFVSQRI